MNALFSNPNSNNNISSTNKSQSKEKNKNYLSVFSNIGSNQNRNLSENKRNIGNFISQKKMGEKEAHSKNQNHNENKNNAFLVSFNDNMNNMNNIKLKNYSNLLNKNYKVIKNNKNKSHCLSKPQLEIEINNINNNSTNYTRVATNNKKYKKNISEHDLVNNILNTFTNGNFPKGVNIKLNFSSKKKLNYDKSKTKQKGDTMDSKKIKQNKITSKTTKSNTRARHASDSKLLRSSSGYSYGNNNNLAQTNSFFNANHSNQLGYISTWGNNQEWTNNNFGNIIKISTQKKSSNANTNHNNSKQKNRNKSSKGPIIGKIIKNYKNNDLNCIFNMNLIPPVSPINNIQDYYKNLYKVEYSDNRNKKNNYEHKKNANNKKEENKDNRDTRTKNSHEEFTQSKNTMTKTSDYSKVKKEKDSIDNIRNEKDCPEEIHFFIISSIQSGKNMEVNLNKK